MKKMRRWAYLLLVFAAGCGEKGQQLKQPPIFRPADSLMTHFHELPPAVRAKLLSVTGGQQFADPGQRWNATDVIVHGIPERRLIFAGTVDGNWFIYYEHGGRGKHEHLVAMSLNAHNRTSILANMYASERWTELAQIKGALENRSFQISDPGHF
jgi:hypothetical protein